MVKVKKNEFASFMTMVGYWVGFGVITAVVLFMLIFFATADNIILSKEELMYSTIMVALMPFVFLPFAIIETCIINNALKDAEKVVKITDFYTKIGGRMFATIDDKEVAIIHRASGLALQTFMNDFDELEVLVTKKGKYYLLNPKARKKNKKSK